MEDLNSIINALSKETNIDKERVEKAIRIAVIQTAKKILHTTATTFKGRFEVDLVSKQPAVYEVFEIVPDSKQIHTDGYIYLKNAVEKSKRRDLRMGDKVEFRYELNSFGRNGSELLSKNIENAIREVKGVSLYFNYKSKIGEKLTAKVVHIAEDGSTILDINDEYIKAIIRPRDKIGEEVYKIGDWISAIIKYVAIDEDDRGTITIELSRTSPKYLETLLHLAIPEIKDGIVTIHNIARIPGKKAKVSVSSNNPKIDPVSAVIGAKGTRITSISAEVNNEIIDCISWNNIPEVYIKNSLSPATIDSIKIVEELDNEKKPINVAYVVIPATERGKAIGKSGMNLKLAKMITGYEIRLLDQNEEQKAETEKKYSAEHILGNLFKN
jgi:N utilization substance protein A